jgi:hypothetical protein
MWETITNGIDDPSAWFVARYLARMAVAPDLPVPDTLYHYTSYAGLDGILKHHKLWATDARALNDSTERHFAHDQLRALFRQLVARHGMEIQPLLDAADAYMQDLEAGGAFVISFSESSDSLGMWERYADRGSGYALGFRTDDIQRIAYGAYEYFVKVAYGDDFFSHPLVRAFDETCTDFLSRPNIDPSAGIALGAFVATAYAAPKHPAFSDEREWRALLCFPEAEYLSKRVSFRQGIDGIRPYLQVGMKGVLGDEAAKVQLPICKVIVGPKLPKQSTRRAVESMLARFGYTATVDESAIPLRI